MYFYVLLFFLLYIRLMIVTGDFTYFFFRTLYSEEENS